MSVDLIKTTLTSGGITRRLDAIFNVAKPSLFELAKAAGQSPKTFFQNKDFKGLSLEDVDIDGVSLSGADLRGAKLRKAKFRKRPDLKKAKIDPEDLVYLAENRLYTARRKTREYSVNIINESVLADIAPRSDWSPISASLYIDRYTELEDVELEKFSKLNEDPVESTQQILGILNIKNPKLFYKDTGISEFQYLEHSPERGLSVQGLELMFAGKEAQPFLRVARLSIKPGQWIVMGGPSGSGKSCLLKALSGLWPYGRGRVIMPKGWKAFYACAKPQLSKIALKQLITMPEREHKYRDIEVAAIMSSVGLADFIPFMLGRYYRNQCWNEVLSEGQKQMVVLARILLHTPDVVFLDEPTSSLDSEARSEFYHLLRRYCPKATVVSTVREEALPTDSLERPFFHAILFIENGRAGLQPVIKPAPPPLRNPPANLPNSSS